MKFKILNKKLLAEELLKPATPGSAAIDLVACIDEPMNIFAGETAMIPAGFAMHIDDKNIAAQILPRSGLGSKGLVLGNGTGLVDSDYQGEIQVCLLNRNAKNKGHFRIKPGDKIAQLVFVPVVHPKVEVVEDFETETKRGKGGFGSTDKTKPGSAARADKVLGKPEE